MTQAKSRNSEGSAEKFLPIAEIEKRCPWVRGIVTLYQHEVANCFVLYGNVHDYAIPGEKVIDLVQKIHADRIVVQYDLAAGVTFPVQGQEAVARQMVAGSAKPAPKSALDSFSNVDDDVEVSIPKNPSGALAWVENLMRVSASAKNVRHVLFIIPMAHTLFPDSSLATMSNEDKAALLTLVKWGTDPGIVTKWAPVIVLLTDSMQSLHSEIRKSSSKFEFLAVDMPDRESRQEMYDLLVDKGMSLEEGFDRAQFVNSVGELSLLDMEDVYLSGKINGPITRRHTLTRKKLIVNKEFGGLLETYDDPLTYNDLFKCEYVKPFMTKYVVLPLQLGDPRLASAGVIMVGPAGTGKSHIARCIAGEAGVNFYGLNMGRIASMWQGEGEKRIERALRMVSDYGGILFIDEINKQVGGGVLGSNKQDERIEGILMEWLADPARLGTVCVLAATNRPEQIKPEMIRPGRFDHILGVFPGDADDRIGFLEIAMARRFGSPVEFDRQVVAGLTERPSRLGINLGWTNAELGGAITKAYHIVKDTGMDPGDALVAALRKLKPATREVEEMTYTALRVINDADLLPPYLARFVGGDEILQEEQKQSYTRGGGRG